MTVNPAEEGGYPIVDPTQFAPDLIRVVLDHGELVELDGGTLVLDSEESPSVVLRLAPWRSVGARVLQEWPSVSRIFHRLIRSYLDELDLSRTLELAAAATATSRSLASVWHTCLRSSASP